MDDSSEFKNELKEERTFPTGSLVLILFLVALQIGMILFIILYKPQPQDWIIDYRITIEPLADGTLDAEYVFTWKALDETEPLTWVEIGMPNESFKLSDSYSDNIAHIYRDAFNDEGFTYTRIDFKKTYFAGDILTFSFHANLGKMLCRDGDSYFYEFVPGWFNATPVDHYLFRWKADGADADAQIVDGYYVWEGSMGCGEKVFMNLTYPSGSFDGAETVKYEPCSRSRTNELAEEKIGISVLLVLVIIGLVVAEVWIVDTFVSYAHGRGFIVMYGYRVHHYGHVNPRYRAERDRRAAASSRGGGHVGGGCACACACACAGGGRAGCSQKDTTEIRPVRSAQKEE